MAIYFLFLANLLSYSFIYREFKTGHFLWSLWAISQYITLSISLINMEKLVYAETFKKKMVFSCLILSILIIIFCLGFYLSVIPRNNWKIYVILSLIIALSIILLMFINKHKKIKDVEINAENSAKLDVFNEYYSYFSSTKKDKLKWEHLKIANSLFFSVIVYGLFLSLIIFANVICKQVTFIHVVIGCILMMCAVIMNQLKINNFLRNIKLSILENGSLILSLSIYMIVEWIFLPVTFNIILVFLCSILIMPIHITQAKIAEQYKKIYK